MERTERQGESVPKTDSPNSSELQEKLAFSIPDAARVLSIGQSLLKEQVRTGKIRGVRIGRRLIIPRAELERFLGEINTWKG